MKILFITGSNGFLGSSIINYLFDNRLLNKVFALSRGLSADSCKSMICNVSYEDFYSNTYKLSKSETGVLLHLAFARSHNTESIIESIRLLEKVSLSAKNSGISTIINVSSQSVYSQYRDKAADESDLPEPQGLYGIAKYYSETYLEHFSRKFDIKIINLRLASLIGPGLDQRIIPRLINSAITEKQIKITSNMEQFSFLHVNDAARMIAEISLNADKANELVYNVGTNEAYNLVEIVQIIVRELKKADIYKPYVIIDKSSGKQFNNSLNLRKIERDFNLFAEISLERAIKLEIMRYLDAE